MMKNAIVVILFFLIGSLLYAQEGVAYIREFIGTVEVKSPGTTEWRSARTGERLQNDTMVSTGFQSTAFIALGNSTLLVRPLTRLSLEEIQNARGNESVRLRLQAGRVRADVNPPPGGQTNFTVISPMVTASVRGTSFEFNGEDLAVDEGRVHVTGGDGSAVYVGAGHKVFSNPETGRTLGAMDTVKEELAPPLPMAAAESAVEPAAAMSAEDTGFGFEWN
ncbi:MAG: FecR family protein [Treponema sp.]|nr:FecR family protein [Treponema sp.]